MNKIVKNETVENIGNKRTVNKKEYIVKSVFLGNKELKDIILKLAESKSVKAMGLT